jgi:hypothetical protein
MRLRGGETKITGKDFNSSAGKESLMELDVRENRGFPRRCEVEESQRGLQNS